MYPYFLVEREMASLLSDIACFCVSGNSYLPLKAPLGGRKERAVRGFSRPWHVG